MTEMQTGVLGLGVFGTLIEIGHRPFAHQTRNMPPQKADLFQRLAMTTQMALSDIDMEIQAGATVGHLTLPLTHISRRDLMARNVFGEDTNAQKAENAAPRKRFPLTVRGATSQKYIGPATEGHAFRTYQEIPLDQIADSQFRGRLNLNEDIEGLVESIRKYGQHIPATVRIVNAQRPYEIVVGRRRLAAMRQLAAAGELKDKTISAFVRKMDDQQALIAQWIENNERLDPSPSRTEVPESSPLCEDQRSNHIDSAIDGDTLTLSVRTEFEAEFFDFLEDKIPDLYAEWVRSRDQPVSTSTLRSDEGA
jgi:hypothetical protein